MGISLDTYTGIFEFKHDMDELARANLINSLNTRIESIFTTGATSTNKDAGLCGIVRFVKQTKEGTSRFSYNPSIPTIFMVLTNEDDESELKKVNDNVGVIMVGAPYARSYLCADHFRQGYTRGYPMRNYRGKVFKYNFELDVQYLVDGVPSTHRVGMGGFNGITANYSSDLFSGKNCIDVVSTYATRIARFASDITRNPGSPLYGMTYLSHNTIRCTVDDFDEHLGSEQLSETYEDKCPYYSSLKTTILIPGSCEGTNSIQENMGDNVNEAIVTASYLPSSSAYTTSDAAKLAYDSIKTNFDLKNIYFTAVINPSTNACPATPGSSVGLKYERLAGFPGMQSEIIPICSSNYGEQIVNTTNFLKTFGLGTFTLNPGYGARVAGVEIIRDRQTLTPSAGTDFNVENDILTFSVGYIRSTDIVKVYLK